MCKGAAAIFNNIDIIINIGPILLSIKFDISIKFIEPVSLYIQTIPNNNNPDPNEPNIKYFNDAS